MRSRLLVGFLFASGCMGSIDGSGPGPGGDDDMPPPPPPPDTITVTITDGSVPQAGVAVVFQNADDSLVADVVTDASGNATAELSSGNVTVIRPDAAGGPAKVFTYIGAKAGDHLALGRPTSPGSPINATVLLPPALQNVTLKTPCGTAQGAPPNVQIVLDGCPAETVFYASDNNQQEYFCKLAAPAPSVDLSLVAVNGRVNSTLNTSYVAGPGETVQIEGRLSMRDFQLFSTGQKNAATPQNVDYPNLVGVDQITVVTVNGAVAAAPASQMTMVRHTFPTTSVVPVTPLAYVTAPVVDAANLTWTETPGTNAAPADFVYASLSVTPAGGTPFTRLVAGPYAGPTLHVPVLPASHAQFNAATGDQVKATPALAKVTGGYDAVRASLFSVTSLIDAAPMDASLTLSYAGRTAP